MSVLGYSAGMTPLQTAEAYLAAERPWAFVEQVWEDDQDWYIQEGLKPGREYPLGPAAILIAKSTGELRTEAWGSVIDRIDVMEPAPPELQPSPLGAP